MQLKVKRGVKDRIEAGLELVNFQSYPASETEPGILTTCVFMFPSHLHLHPLPLREVDRSSAKAPLDRRGASSPVQIDFALSWQAGAYASALYLWLQQSLREWMENRFSNKENTLAWPRL